MALLLFSLNACPETPDGASFKRFIAAVEDRFPGEFFLVVTARPPADTGDQPNWDWATLPERASDATWKKLLLAYGRWLKPTVSVFWGTESAHWCEWAKSGFGTRLLAEPHASTGAPQSTAEHRFYGPETAEQALKLLERQLPLTLTLSPTLSTEEIGLSLASREDAPEVRVHCNGPIRAKERAQLKHVEKTYEGKIRLIIPLREGILSGTSAGTTLRFILSRRARYQLTVTSPGRMGATAAIDRVWRTLLAKT